MGEVLRIVVELQREKLRVLRSGTIALRRPLFLESLAELGVEHDICTPRVSEPDVDLAGDGRSLGTHGDEPRGCAVVGAVEGCFAERSSKYSCSRQDTEHGKSRSLDSRQIRMLVESSYEMCYARGTNTL